MSFFNVRWFFACLMLFSGVVFAAPIKVTDVAGREVTLNGPAKRVILADGRALLALNVLHPQDPLENIIAWDNSLKVKAPDIVEAYSKKFPQASKIPMFENPYSSDFNVEQAVVMQPDLVIFDLGILPKLKSSGVLSQLEKIGIPVLIIDFRQQPLVNTIPSMRLLGEVFGQQERAEAYIKFYQQRMALVQQRIATLKPNQRPSVFIERSAGIRPGECCNTFGKGSYGQFIDAAGGDNIGSKLFPEMGGQVNIEQIITANPDYYLMTGADWGRGQRKTESVPLGYAADKASSQQKFDALLNRTGINVLPAIKNKRVMAIYHQFYDSPFNFLAVEAIAKFLHPALFTDIDPQADIESVHRDFTDLDYSGVFWVTAK